MKKAMKIIFRILLISLVLIFMIFIFRTINSYRYRKYEQSDEAEIYVNPADLSLYDTDVEEIEIEILEEGLLNGFHFIPEHREKEGVVVTFGGSEGSPNYEIARSLAEKGYEVYSLFYFGPGDLPDELVEIPLEFFEDFLTYHEKHSQTAGPLTLLGASKGAELVLNLATHYDEIDSIVLYAPSAYSFFSLDQGNTNRSSWSFQGQAVPYLSNRKGSILETLKMISSFMFYTPVKYEPIYDSVIAGTDENDLESARIKAENFKGEGLIFAGGSDLMWSSEDMAKKIESHAENFDVFIYPKAGHSFSLPPYLKTKEAILAFGGTEKENEQALEKSNEILFKKLEEWHKK